MPPEPLSPATVADIIAEINSEYRADSFSGPKKEITGVALEDVGFDAPRLAATATLCVHAYREDPYGGSASTSRDFTVTAAEMAALAEAAPRYTGSFALMRKSLLEFQEKKIREEREMMEKLCDAGLPAQEDVAVLRPPRLNAPRPKR